MRAVLSILALILLPTALHHGLLWLGLPVLATYLTISAAGIQAAIYLSLLLAFGLSLRPGRVPLITRIATATRGALPPELIRYTRHVTIAWACFCLAQLVISGTLLAFAPPHEWSFFVTSLTLPLLALMAGGEYLVRILRFRHLGHESLPEMLHVMRNFRHALRQP